MFKKFYTTGMSGDARVIARRFKRINSHHGSHAVAAALTAGIITAAMAGSVLAAGILGSGATVIIGGKSRKIDIVHIDNTRYTYTDSWYVPLRDIFEMLGCTVSYNVEKPEIYQNSQTEYPQYNSWEKGFVVDDVTAQVYGAVHTSSNMPVIEIETPSGESLYCQIGSCDFASTAPVIMIDSKAYVPIRAVAQYLGGGNNLKWDGIAHDTYYEGILNWDEDTMTITINEADTSSEYYEVIARLNSDGFKVEEFLETRKYVFCVVERGDGTRELTAISKADAKTSVLDEISDESLRLHLELDENDPAAVRLNTLAPNGEGEYAMTEYGCYRVE